MPITCCVSASVTEKIIQVQCCFLFTTLHGVKEKHDWCNETRTRRKYVPTLIFLLCTGTAQSWRLTEHTLSNVPGYWDALRAGSFMDLWAYYALPKVIPINLVSILECQGSSAWVDNFAYWRQAVLRTLQMHVSMSVSIGCVVIQYMQMSWRYSEFQTWLRLVVYFQPANNNQILKDHILQLYCMCLGGKFLDLQVLVLTH